MGTTFNRGDKPQNNVTVSKSSAAPRKINPESGQVDRSFAQPNPAIEQPKVEPKAHASAQDEVEALEKNSEQGRDYKNDDGDSDAN